MNDDVGCEQVRALAADLAIGIADGQDRDAALRHAAACAECRLLVSELSSVVDDLLLLAPSHEPPAGFASRTLARMTSSSPRPGQRATRRAPRRTAGRRPWMARLAVAAPGPGRHPRQRVRIPGPALLAVRHPEPTHGTTRTLRCPAGHPRRQAPVPRRNGPRRPQPPKPLEPGLTEPTPAGRTSSTTSPPGWKTRPEAIAGQALSPLGT